MSIVTISDIHIKENSDAGAKLLEKFFAHADVKKSESIYFLGDIFDLMIGPHEIYFKKYNVFFDGIKKCILNGQIVYYIEGNHDFHLRKLFKAFLELNNLDPTKLIFSNKAIVQTIYNKKIYFSHGDDIEINNPNYKKYKKIITSKPLEILANYIMPYSLLNWIGTKASKTSRSYNKEKYDDKPDSMDAVRASFQKASTIISHEQKLDYIICGHSHVEENFITSNNSLYLNNGYVQSSKKFVYLDNEKAMLVDL